MKGISVGTVKSISLTKDNVFVNIKTSSPLDIHRGYRVITMDAGIMGDRMIMIDNGPQNSLRINQADTLFGIFTPGVSEAVGAMGTLQGVVDSLKEISETLLRGNFRNKSLVFQVNAIVRSVDSLTKKASIAAKSFEHDMAQGIDTLDKVINGTAMISKSLAVSAPEYLDIINNRISQTKALLTSADSTVEQVSTLSASLQKDNSVLWGNEISNLHTTVNILHTTISDIHRDMLQFKIFLGLW